MRFAAFAPERVSHAILLSPVGIAPFRIYWRSGVPLVLNLRNDPTYFGQRLMRMVFVPPRSNLKFNREVFYALSLVVKHYNAGALAGMSTTPTLSEVLRGTRALIKFVRGEPSRVLRAVRPPTLLLVGQHEAFSTRARQCGALYATCRRCTLKSCRTSVMLPFTTPPSRSTGASTNSCTLSSSLYVFHNSAMRLQLTGSLRRLIIAKQ